MFSDKSKLVYFGTHSVTVTYSRFPPVKENDLLTNVVTPYIHKPCQRGSLNIMKHSQSNMAKHRSLIINCHCDINRIVNQTIIIL